MSTSTATSGTAAKRGGSSAGGASSTHPRRGRRFLNRHAWWPYALPGVGLVVVFFLVPFLLNLRFSFTNWSSFTDVITWNGLRNFETLIDQNIFWPSVQVTLIYAVTAMVVQNVVSLPLAYALRDTNGINSFFRSLFFLPVLIAPVAAGYIFSALLSPAGPLNAAVAAAIPGFDFAWLGETSTAIFIVAAVDAWKWSGVITLVYIAGLNAIPQSFIEAARIDGANRLRVFRSIELPLLAPAVTFNVVVTLLGAISAFDIVVSATGGGPGNSTTVLNLAMFRQWGAGFFGTASALSLTVAVLVIVIALPLVSFLRKREVEM
ncbi:raffinose/stachyose/melibiose transport system permease protein [Microbacterium sp. W4I4]|uniref:carbohydrate ABC transporter permease n=1 Tax=Microbacterium sp. W4I4 TaxID=3042295 RepID=UPI00277E726B|nr:sugar ABC transporter permease [Microbacterium sp. W4I4]MDQ0613994.1 raffinose/stachyose/melibiose transport system permease protein [Microbacterium sp. W4I4]